MIIATAVGIFLGCAVPAQAATPAKIAAADAYVQALLSHDASNVPLAADAHRVENGLVTGVSGADIRFQLDYGPQYRIITAIRDLTWTVTGDTVLGDYLLDTAVPGVPVRLATAHVVETFTIPADTEIHDINATITATPG